MNLILVLHYREQGFWNTLCPKTNPEDHQRIEHYRLGLANLYISKSLPYRN